MFEQRLDFRREGEQRAVVVVIKGLLPETVARAVEAPRFLVQMANANMPRNRSTHAGPYSS